ncbi:MAG: hypothetical protein C4348_00160 [Patescibacteria group bacterium]
MRGLIIGFLLGILVSLNYYFLYAWVNPTSNPPSGGGLIQTQPGSSFPLILTTSTIVNSGNLVVQNGNVGIGTTNPQYRLDVAGDIRGQNNLYISGNVGIGTTAPTDKLHVEGVIKTRTFPANDNTPGLAGFAWESRSSGGGTIRWVMWTAPVGGGWGVPPNSLSLYKYPDIVSVLTILPTGNVGIGTTNPTARLEVNGTLKFTGGKGPFCIFANACPNGWVDKGLGGYIYDRGGGATCPYTQGADYNASWTWCHPRICCNQ